MANLDEKYDIDNRTVAFENHESGILVSLAGPGTGKTYLQAAMTLVTPDSNAKSCNNLGYSFMDRQST